MKVMESSLVQLAAGLTVLVGLWWVGNKVNVNLAQLPVEQAADVSAAATPAAVKPIFPVEVQPRTKIAKSLDALGSDAVEAAFGSRADEVQVAPPPDFAEMVRGTIRIDGVSSGGVFVGGRFYAVGSTITSLQASAEGMTAAPRVVAARPERVVFEVGGSSLVLTKSDGGWH